MKQIKVGVVGTSGRGILAKYLHDKNGRSIVIAGADPNKEALTKFKAEISPDAFTTTDYNEMLKIDEIDAIVVTSPDFTHEEYVLKAFKAGKHVFCEKPMAITTDGCDKMLKAWHESGKQFMIGFNMRYMNMFRVMKDIVDSGTIGEIKVVWVRHFIGSGGMFYYHDWHAQRKYSTSLLLQKASHDIDMIHWITGKYTKRAMGFGSLDYYGGDKPDNLRCTQCKDKDSCVEYEYKPDRGGNKWEMCAFRKEIDVEDNSTILLELDGGIKATYMQCHYTPDYFRNYTFIGTEGRLENLDDGSKVSVKLRDRSKRWKNFADQTYEIRPVKGDDEGHNGADSVICKDFIDMIVEGKHPVATPLAGRMSVATACAATYSIRNGNKMVDIPPLPVSIRNKVF